MIYTKEEYELFSNELHFSDIGTVWSAMRPINFDRREMSFEERKVYFFDLLEGLIYEDKISFTDERGTLHGTSHEQLIYYKSIFPKSQEEMDAGAFDGAWIIIDESSVELSWNHN